MTIKQMRWDLLLLHTLDSLARNNKHHCQVLSTKSIDLRRDSNQ